MRLWKVMVLMGAAIAALVVLAGCESGNVDGYTWKKVADPMTSYTWMVVPQVEYEGLCSENAVKATGWACSFRSPDGDCLVISWKTEDEAQHFKPSGPLGVTTLFEHEVWNDKKTLGHCAGYDHPGQAHVRTV